MNRDLHASAPLDMSTRTNDDDFSDLFRTNDLDQSHDSSFSFLNHETIGANTFDTYQSEAGGSAYNSGFTFAAPPQSIDPRQTAIDTNVSPSHVTQHGLITPPTTKDEEDDDDAEMEECMHQPSTSDTRGPSKSLPKNKRQQSASSASGRERNESFSSTSTRAGATMKRPTQSRSSTRKARKGYKATTKEEEDDPEGEEKRVKFLERNRVAATKCRDKKRIWVNRLEEHLREGQSNHHALMEQVAGLQSELVQLKEEALKHFECSPKIRDWLVSRVGPTQDTPTPLAPMATAPQYRQRDSGLGSAMRLHSPVGDSGSAAFSHTLQAQYHTERKIEHGQSPAQSPVDGHALSRASSVMAPASDMSDDSELRAMLEATLHSGPVTPAI